MAKQPHLVPPPPGIRGRRQNVTAHAWIERPSKGANFLSRVSLGKGRIYERSTQTTRRNLALAFNRAHLMELLTKSKPAPSAPPPTQLDLTEWCPPSEPQAS